MRKLKITEMQRLSAEEFRRASKMPLVVVLDNVRSLHNVGSVFRTADAFRVEAVYLCGITSAPPSAEIHKTALGAEDAVAWRYFEQTADALAELRSRGYRLAAVEQATDSVAPADFDFSGKTAVVLGHEVKGVGQEAIDLCDACIEIPQHGTKHSLNVSVAAGIIIWEAAKSCLSVRSLF